MRSFSLLSDARQRFQPQPPQANMRVHDPAAQVSTAHSRLQGFPSTTFTPSHPVQHPAHPCSAPRALCTLLTAETGSGRHEGTGNVGCWGGRMQPGTYSVSIYNARSSLAAPVGANPSARAWQGPPLCKGAPPACIPAQLLPETGWFAW